MQQRIMLRTCSFIIYIVLYTAHATWARAEVYHLEHNIEGHGHGAAHMCKLWKKENSQSLQGSSQGQSHTLYCHVYLTVRE